MAASGIQRAVDLFGGSPSALASELGGKVVRQHVEYWLKVGRVPAEHVPGVHRAVGGRIPYQDLNTEVDWAYVQSTGFASGQPDQAVAAPDSRQADVHAASLPARQ